MKKIINLYGGPGTGKSTTAAALFALFKQRGYNAELVREYIKNWVWEGRKILPGDQVYIAAKQSRQERIHFKDVDIIITDAPVLLSVFYEEKYDAEIPVCRQIFRKHQAQIVEAGFEICHVFLNRKKAYNPKGRFQSEEEAGVFDVEIKQLLLEMSLPFITVDANADAASLIFDVILAGAFDEENN